MTLIWFTLIVTALVAYGVGRLTAWAEYDRRLVEIETDAARQAQRVELHDWAATLDWPGEAR